MSLTVTILGCGSSGGVPRPASGWGACDPNNPKNRRRRCSLLIERKSERGVTRVLVDTSPDLREQLIDANVDHLDAVFMTHEHADQLHGMDDLRPVVLHMRARIPVYMSQAASRDILVRFGYCFTQPPGSDYPPILDLRYVEAGEERTIEGKGGPLTLKPFLVDHGKMPAFGYRFGGVAYSPDMNDIPRQSLGAAAGPRSVDHRRAALRAASDPHQCRSGAILDRADEAARGDHHQHARRPRLRGAAGKAAGRRRAGVRRDADRGGKS